MRDLTYPPIILAVQDRPSGCSASGSTCTGTEHVPRTGGVLLAVNHVGYVDFVYGGLAANPSGRKVRFMAKRELFDHRLDRPADALDAPHRGRPGRRVRRRTGRRWSTSVPARRSASSPRPPSRARWSSRSSRPARCGSPPTAGVPLVPGGAVGHPADDDQGPPAGLLPRQDDPDPGRASRCTPPATDPVAETAELHARDVGAARRGDRGLPRRRAAARRLVGAGVARRQSHPPWRRRPGSTPRRSASARPAAPAAEDSASR